MRATLRRRYRAVFISDLHLGTPGCQAAALLDFLKSHPSDYLYLVGGIEARARALDFSWQHATQLFASFLVPARAPAGRAPSGLVGTTTRTAGTERTWT